MSGEIYIGVELIDLRVLRSAKRDIEAITKDKLQVIAGRKLLGTDTELRVRWRTRYLDYAKRICDEDSLHAFYKEIALQILVIK